MMERAATAQKDAMWAKEEKAEEGKAEEEEEEEGKEKAEEGRGCPWPCGMLLRFLPVFSLTVLTPLRHVLLHALRHALHAVTMNIRRSITAPSLYEGEAEDEGGER
jgi:hypothetical protein